MSKVYNKSALFVEPAEWKTCPRCKGAGAIAFKDEDNCPLCNGYGSLWISDSGWTRAKFRKLEDSQLY